MPYARLARQRGNGLVLILANLGIIMQMLWILAICKCYESLNQGILIYRRLNAISNASRACVGVCHIPRYRGGAESGLCNALVYCIGYVNK